MELLFEERASDSQQLDWFSQSNPWITDNATVAENYWGASAPLCGLGGTAAGGGPHMGELSIRRVKRWSFSFQELLKDPLGRAKFQRWLEKEFAAENLMFWQECQVGIICTGQSNPHFFTMFVFYV